MAHVVKRDGRREAVSFDKILRRVESLCAWLPAADPVRVAKRVVQGVYDGVKTSELDELAAETAAALAAQHPDYGQLAGRIAVSNLHKASLNDTSYFGATAMFRDDSKSFLHDDYFGAATLRRTDMTCLDELDEASVASEK